MPHRHIDAVRDDPRQFWSRCRSACTAGWSARRIHWVRGRV